MSENPSTVHGRLNEAMHIAGYAFERAWQKFEWLLDDDRWKQVGDGYDDINGFLATVQLPKGATPEQRKAVAEKIKALQPTASQRKIAGTLGVSEQTVARDMGKPRRSAPKGAPEARKTKPGANGEADIAPLGAPESAGDVVAAAAKKQADAKTRKEETRQERKDRAQPANGVDASLVTLVHKAVADVDIGEVGWIITDPPYPEEHLGAWDDLGAFAMRALKPGGSLLAMSGQYHLPQVLERLIRSGLTYHWTLAYLTPGGQSVQLWPRNVNTFWKPLIWMTKGEYSGHWIGDVAKSDPNDNDKRFHEWGQSESGMADIIGRFTEKDDVICDPFCGGGATIAAALSLGRRVIGIDVDPTAIQACRERFGVVG